MARDDLPATGCVSPRTVEDGLSVPPHSGRLFVSGSASTNYAIKKMFHSSYQYALFNYNETLLQIRFADIRSAINETVIKGRLEQLATFDSSKNDIVADYKKLFKTLGTHVITGASYGGRFQLVN